MHVGRLKQFIGTTRKDGFELAKKESNQFDADKIIAYRGDLETRTTMELLL